MTFLRVALVGCGAIVGGRFVDGIVFHPTQRRLRYARTDMGGAYRWEDRAKRWTDDQRQRGLLFQITGDPQRYGRVYVGTHGRGTVYGDPAPSP